MSHNIIPELIEMFQRYQCKTCHSWIRYSEWSGRWYHKELMQEEMKEWSWNGSAWIHDSAVRSES